MDLSRQGNKYMQEAAPWLLAKEQTEQAQKLIDNCLHVCLQLTANLAILINPFLPATAKKMCHMMKVVERMLDWENAGKQDLLKVNYPLRAPELLFQKIEDIAITGQIEKLHAQAVKPTIQEAVAEMQDEIAFEWEPVKESIQYDDFAKI